MQKKHKTQHLSMKNGAIFEIFVCKKVNSCNINALGSKKNVILLPDDFFKVRLNGLFH